MNVDELKARLDAELTPLPTDPATPYDAIVAAAEHRRRVSRGTAAGAGLAIAASIVAVVLVASSSGTTSARPVVPPHLGTGAPSPDPTSEPSPSASPSPGAFTIPAVAGDVDGDGKPDVVTLEGGTPVDSSGYAPQLHALKDPTLVLTGTRVGRLTLPLIGDGVYLDHTAPVDIFGDGHPLIAIHPEIGGDSIVWGLVQLDGDHLHQVTGLDAKPLELIDGGGINTETTWSCTSADLQANKPGLLVIATSNNPTFGQAGDTNARHDETATRYTILDGQLHKAESTLPNPVVTNGVPRATTLQQYDLCGEPQQG